MPKYIDADRLIRRLEKSTYRAKTKIIDMINEQEAADVEPVRRGSWVGIDDEPYEVWECDKCGHIVEREAPPNFCEECGADMRAWKK